MLVKDQITGEKRPKEELFCVTTINGNGKKVNKYYSSEETYNLLIKNKENKNKCTQLIYELLNYKEFMKVPTFWYKKLSEWEPYGYDVVLMCITNKTKDIKWALNNKTFNQETGKIMYICAIIENGMNDALKEKIRKDKIEENNRRSNESDNVIIDVNLSEIGKQNTNTNERSNLINDLLGNL